MITKNPRIGYIILPKRMTNAMIVPEMPHWLRTVNEQRKNLLSYSHLLSGSAVERLTFYMSMGQMPEDEYIANTREQLVTFIGEPHPRVYDERFRRIGVACTPQAYGTVNLVLLKEEL